MVTYSHIKGKFAGGKNIMNHLIPTACGPIPWIGDQESEEEQED